MDIKLFCNKLLLKLSTFILLSISLQLSARGLSQNLSLSFYHVPLESVLRAIEQQSSYRFIYTSEEIEKACPITIEVKKGGIDKVLESCFTNQPLTYQLEGKFIAIKYKTNTVFNDTLRVVRGMVYDEQNHPLPGITVMLKRNGAGTATDATGNFAMHNLLQNDLLVFTGVNIETKEVAVVDGRFLFVHLISKIKSLKDVTVTISNGYQEIPKERETGSFDFIDNKLFNREISTDIVSRLAGIASGLMIDQNAGNDLNLSIRGKSTIFSSTQPLIVLDNFEYDGDINNINPNDVESITVLKDAAAASIWGAKSGNGVLVITTKKGKFNTTPVVSINSNLSIGGKPDLFYMRTLSSPDYIGVEKYLFAQGYYNSILNEPNRPSVTPVVEILNNQANGIITAQQASDQINALQNHDVRNDLLKYFYTKPVYQQYAINLSGGGPNQQYYVSFGYDKNQTNIIGNQFGRISINANNTYSIIHGKLEINTGILFSQNRTQTNGLSEGQITAGNKALYPYAQLADAKGNALPIEKYRKGYLDTAGGGALLDWQYRPLDEIKMADNNTTILNYQFALGIKYKLLKSLSLGLKYLYGDGETNIRHYFSPQTYYARNQINQFTELTPRGPVYPIPLGGILGTENSSYTSQNFRSQLDYAKRWNQKNQLTAIAGLEMKDLSTVGSSATIYGYDQVHATSIPVDYVSYFPNYINGNPQQISGGEVLNSLSDRYLSYYMNAAYNYKEKYTISGSARQDASNLFGVNANQKAVPLWSAGLSWNLSKEDFYHVNGLPYLKFSITYGYNGNINKNVTALLTSMVIGPNDFGQMYSNIINQPNPNLRWERVKILNGKIEFASSHDRVTGTVEYYLKNGLDLLGYESLPPSTGITGLLNFMGNSANMRGNGLDLTINTKNTTGLLKWNTSLLFSLSKNRITAYSAKIKSNSAYITWSGFNPKVGGPVNAIYSYRWAGLDPKGNPRGYLSGKISEDYAGIINSSNAGDLQYNGPGFPVVFGGLMNTITYKQFSLSFNISYKFGYYFRRISIDYYNLFGGYLPGHVDFDHRWQQPGDEKHTSIPAMIYPADSYRDRFYTNASVLVTPADHIRLQDIQCSYEPIKRQIKNFPFQHLRIFLYASNLGILWRANQYHLDPDYASSIDNYPPAKTIATGFNINF